jgi:hypothetical protein
MVSARTKINKRRVASYIGAGVIGGGGGGGGSTPAIIAANRTNWPTQLASVAPNQGYAKEHYASPEGALSDIVMTWCGWHINGTFGITDASTSNIKAFIEYPAGTFTPVLFGGSATGSIPAAGQVSNDPVAGVSVPAGNKFWSHTIRVSGSAGNMALIELPATSAALGVTDTSYTYSGSGNPPARPAADASNVHLGPSAITGTIAAAGASGFLSTGDSINQGQGNIGAVGVRGGSGFISQGLDKRYSYAKWAKGGMTGVQLAALAGNSRIIALRDACKCTDVLSEWGGGDLRDGQTVAAILAAYQTIYGLFPGKRIGQTTVLPRTDSTDGWATVANQAAKTDGNWADEINLNAAIRAGLPGVSYVIESSDLASSAHDSRKHKAPPVPSIDGVHPNDYFAAFLSECVYRSKLGRAGIAPGAVGSLAISSQGSTNLSYSYAKPALGTDTITYLVEYKRTVDSAWTTLGSGLTTLTGSIAGLTVSTSYDIRVTPSNDAGTGPSSTVTASTTGAFQPSDLGGTVIAFDSNNVSETPVDGSNNLLSWGDIYSAGQLVIGGAPTVITNGGQSGNKRAIAFPAGAYLKGNLFAALLDIPDGATATTKFTVVEALKYASGTSRGFFFGTQGTSKASIGQRQTASNRGPSVVEVDARTAVSAFEAILDTANYHVYTTIKDGLNLIFRVDGVQKATATLAGDGTWNFTDFYIGTTSGTTTAGTPSTVAPPANQTGLVIVKDALSAPNLALLEAWVGATAGL